MGKSKSSYRICQFFESAIMRMQKFCQPVRLHMKIKKYSILHMKVKQYSLFVDTKFDLKIKNAIANVKNSDNF